MRDGPKCVGEIPPHLPVVCEAAARARPLTRVQRRLIEASAAIQADDPDTLLFQHTVFCQTGMPYRDPGPEVRLWQRTQGSAYLEVQAGRLFQPRLGTAIDVGLPWGPKPRLILAHVNAEALRQGNNVIEIEDSLSAFVKRIRGFQHGREIRVFKEQLTRLANALVRLAVSHGDRVHQINTQVISAFDLWLQKDQRQRILWPSTIALSLEYYDSLQRHAVPLDERSVAALAHSAVGLDVYAWLSQRLHRIDSAKPQFIAWASLKEQFGPDYGRMDNFKAFFRRALKAVLSQYTTARVELDGRGMTAFNSPPPVTKRLVLLPKF